MDPLDDRYLLGQRIGRGGIGEVHEGLQAALSRPVAIKVLRSEYTANPWAVARFQREAQTLSRLQHPNVVTVIDVGQARDGRHFLVMELLVGENLGAHMARVGQMSVAEAMRVASGLVRGMGAGRGVGLVHRDLKPENIFLTSDGQVKILDFGLALLREGSAASASEEGASGAYSALAAVDGARRSLLPTSSSRVDASRGAGPIATTFDSLEGGAGVRSGGKRPSAPEPGRGPSLGGRLTSVGTVVGTPRYISPEQALGWQVDHRADLYAFGCILFEMVAGAPPFEAETSQEYLEMHVRSLPPLLDELVEATPEPLVQLVDDLLSKDPAARPADWSVVAESLRSIRSLVLPQEGPSSDVLVDGASLLGSAAPTARSDERPALPAEPYRFLQPFTGVTRTIFFGRDRDHDRFRGIWEDPDRPPLVILTGASGVGKTSFLYARVVPWLEDTGHVLLRVRGGARPLAALRGAACRMLGRSSRDPGSLAELLEALSQRAGPVTAVLDQLEEVFTDGDEEAQRSLQAGLASIVVGGVVGVRFLIGVREEFLGRLLRTLHPLPVDHLSRTFALRPLEVEDVHEALVGPSRPGIAVDYAPFSFEDGLVDEITADLMSDAEGEVAPRIQAVGSRLWEMIREEGETVISRRHYRERLGGAREIVGRVLDEAIEGLGPAERGVAKELLRALTHLPGSPTSHPTPGSALVGLSADAERRREILRALESRWRVIQGYVDPRWPDERTYRIAHEALIARIQDYGEETDDRNRARQIFQQGLALWLKNGKLDEDLLPDAHYELVKDHARDLIFTTAEQQSYFDACQVRHNEGWLARYKAARRRRIWRVLYLPVLGTGFMSIGAVIGQSPVQFHTLQTVRIRWLARTDVPSPDLEGLVLKHGDLTGLELDAPRLNGADLRGTDLSGMGLQDAQLRDADLRGARLDGARLIGADLSGAWVERVRLHGADLRSASLADIEGDAEFDLALFDRNTTWGGSGPPSGALGPNGRAEGLEAAGASLQGLDLFSMRLTGANLSGADLSRSSLVNADLSGASLEGASLRESDLSSADLGWASLTLASLAQASLIRADLQDAALRGASLVGADLSGAQLKGVDLTGALADRRTRWPDGFDPVAAGVVQLLPERTVPRALGGVDFFHAVLTGLQLTEVQLDGAVLAGADLSSADLSGATLVGADLRGARLDGADICGADFSGAQLAGATWRDARDCAETQWPAERPF